MTTFDSTKASLSDLLREIREGKIQLPDFQRGWVWDDDHIRDLPVRSEIKAPLPIYIACFAERGAHSRLIRSRGEECIADYLHLYVYRRIN